MDRTIFEEKLIWSTTELISTQKGRINAMLNPLFVKGDEQNLSWEVRFPFEDWMKNRAGQLHGGIIATMFDFAFGCLVRAAGNLDFAPTMELDTTYLKPVTDGKSVLVKSTIIHKGRRITHIQGEMLEEGKEKNAAMAKGIFFNEDTRKNNIR